MINWQKQKRNWIHAFSTVSAISNTSLHIVVSFVDPLEKIYNNLFVVISKPLDGIRRNSGSIYGLAVACVNAKQP